MIIGFNHDSQVWMRSKQLLLSNNQQASADFLARYRHYTYHVMSIQKVLDSHNQPDIHHIYSALKMSAS